MRTACGSAPVFPRLFTHGLVTLSLPCVLLALALGSIGCKQEQPTASSTSAPDTPKPQTAARVQPGEQEKTPATLPATPDSTAETTPELIGIPHEWRKAIGIAQREAEEKPGDAQAIGRLGMLYLAADAAPRAVECFQKASKLADDELKWQYLLGVANERTYSPDNAIKAYWAALDIDSDYLPAILRLAEILLPTAPEKAKTLYMRASTLAPDECRVTLGLSKIAYNEDDLEAAARYLKRTVELAPEFASAHAKLAEIYDKLGRSEDAEQQRTLSKGNDRLPEVNDPCWAELTALSHEVQEPLQYAEFLVKQGNADAALQVMDNALKIYPDNTTIRRRYGQTLGMLGRFDDAISELRKISKSDPQATGVAVDIASILVDAKRFDEAETVFEEAIENDESARSSLPGTYGAFLMVVGRADEAISLLAPLTQSADAHVLDRMNLVLAYMCTKQFDKAIEEYRMLRGNPAKAPYTAQTLVGGAVTLMLRQHNADIAAEKKPILLQPQDFIQLADAFASQKMEEESQVLRNYVHPIAQNAMRLAEQGYFDRALRYLDDVMPADLGAVLLNTKGAVLGMKGEPAEALVCFEQALKINPDLSSARTGKVQALMDLGRTEEAGRLLDTIIAERPNDPAALQAYAMMLAGANRMDDALAMLQRAAELQPQNSAHRQLRAELLASLKRFDEAITDAKAALEVSPENTAVRHLLAVCLHQKGRTDEAKAQWAKMIELNPNLLEPRMALVELAELDNNTREAQKLLRDGLKVVPNSPVLANALAWSLATCNDSTLRHGREAVELATKACSLTNYKEPALLDTLAASYAEAGDFNNAIDTQKRAISVAEKQNATAEVEAYKERMKMYEAGKPYRAPKK